MSLTRKTSTAAKKHGKPGRQDLVVALAEREAELADARLQQAATAEVLKVIAASPTDVQPVFEAIAARANRLIGGYSTAVFRIFGDAVHLAAFTSVNAKADEALKAMFPMPRAQFPGLKSISRGDSAQVTDTELDGGVRDLARLRGYRSMLFTPLLSNGAPIGIISVTRQAPGAFSAHQEQLLQTFADQAVIAMNNVGLFNETQEALKQQTATVEILKVIAGSPSDVNPVFEAVADRARDLLDCWSALVVRFDGEQAHFGAARGALPDTEQFVRQQYPTRPEPESTLGRCLLERTAVSHPNLQTGESPTLREYARTRGFRAVMSVPMLQDGRPIGAIIVTRQKAGDFTTRESALLQTFAAQAAIAIENTRLFNETKEALAQQTATADVLKVISRSAFDLQTVLDTLIASAVRLSGARGGAVCVREGDVFRFRAIVDPHPEVVRGIIGREVTPGRGSVAGRVLLSRKVEEIPDVKDLPEYEFPEAGSRARLGVPMLRDDAVVGVFTLVREEPGHFSPRAIELVRSFADQAVIAIENVRLFDEVQARTRDLEESLAQQTATADVLKVISRSAFDLQTVLDALVESAARICEAEKGCIMQRQGDQYHWVSNFGFSPEHDAYVRAHPMTAGGYSATARVARDRRAVHIPDVLADPDYTASENQRLGNYRTILGVPLLRDGEPIGAFIMTREAVRPFNQRQIDLLQTFADQAVIAIENARLFDEVQAKTRDLTEALQQQTATAEVLKVISRSAFDLQAVFDTLISSAIELVGGTQGTIFVRDGDVYRTRAHSGVAPEFARYLDENPPVASNRSATGRVLLTGAVATVEDVLQDPDYGYPTNLLNQSRSILAAPMLRNERVEGVLTVSRTQPGSFTRRQIELLQTFADQAVIAIENVRLFDEVQARTRDLTEALQQQTATAEVLKVISRSAFDLQAVWRTLVESASTLCEAPMGLIELLDGDVFRLAMQKGYGEAFERYLLETPLRAGSSSGTGRAASTGEVSHIPDVLQDPDYLLSEAQRLAGYRSNLAVPLLRENKVIGVFVLGRPTPGPFTERQIELVKTFADQAVIAIENVRLFDEVQARTRDLAEALQQQTATADVLKAISRSALDLQAVLDTLVRSAVSLCEGDGGLIYQKSGDAFYGKAFADYSEEFIRIFKTTPQLPGRGTVGARVLLTGEVQNIADLRADPDYDPSVAAITRHNAVLGVPLLRDRTIVGAIVVARAKPGAFTQRQVELVQTFADQAVIAIENVRLFDEVQARTRDLSEALQLQTATAEVLKVISRSAFDLRAVFETLISSAVELCGADGGTICVRDGEVFRFRASAGASQTEALTKYLEEHPATPGPGSTAGRVLLSGKVEAIPDCLEDPDYAIPMDSLSQSVRSILGVPLLRKEGIEGALVLTRKEPGHFTERQIEIVQTFADQAVIAIENVRLFDEVQARTKELAASLDDLRKAQDRLIQSEKLASLGQLTAGIAHEIKNPLNFVNNFSALSRELVGELADAIKGAPLDEATREETDELIGAIDGNLDKVVQHGKRADLIVKNMLLHSREGCGERSTTNINAMVEEALNLAYHGARAEKPGFNVTIAKSLDPNAGAAEVYAQEMTRVLLNLISNGFYATNKRKHSQGDGAYEPTIVASTRDRGPSVEIAIRDNGTGISHEVRAKMFNPFFTTKPAGEGTGLGLSLSHDIVVKQHGGTIEVSTEPGAFTQFTIMLPRGAAGA